MFNTPDDIKIYGDMLDRFSNMSKSLASILYALGYDDEKTEIIVGEGHYNTLQDRSSGYIRYARHIARPLRGLFGAFVLLHIPEMALLGDYQSILVKKVILL